jgi:uncharacterized protein YndB with AHSA1/START domain
MTTGETTTGKTPTGKTRDAGWEIGVSRTVNHPVERVWDVLTSRRGLATWLGAGARPNPEKRATYTSTDGTTGEVRSWHPRDRIRATWRPAGWDHDSTVQVAVAGRGEKTRITLHQERLASARERETQREHWQAVMDRIVEALET